MHSAVGRSVGRSVCTGLVQVECNVTVVWYGMVMVTGMEIDVESTLCMVPYLTLHRYPKVMGRQHDLDPVLTLPKVEQIQ